MQKDRIQCCEDRLFTWDGYDFVTSTSLQFYNCVLLVDIGEHKAGSRFDGIVVAPEKQEISLDRWDDAGMVIAENTYRLRYTVGEKLSVKQPFA